MTYLQKTQISIIAIDKTNNEDYNIIIDQLNINIKMTRTIDKPRISINDLMQDQLELNDTSGRWIPELYWELSDESLESARNILMQLPLVHRTHVQRFSGDQPMNETLYDTPVPASFLETDTPSGGDNTYKADHELGLDQYTFLGWGGVLHEESGDFLGDADFAVLVSPEILFDDNCVVTQRDVATFLPEDTLHDGIEGNDHARAMAERYLETVVGGKVWFEVITRRVAKAIEDQDPIDLSLETLGEIKYRGPIPRGAIIGAMDIRSAEYEQYIDHISEFSRGLLRLKTAGYLARLVHKVFNLR